jgi:hypothetical protein
VQLWLRARVKGVPEQGSVNADPALGWVDKVSREK